MLQRLFGTPIGHSFFSSFGSLIGAVCVEFRWIEPMVVHPATHRKFNEVAGEQDVISALQSGRLEYGFRK